MRLLLIAFLLNCQVQYNPTLADEFVHGEIQSRKRVIEQGFALWQVRGQVDITDKREDNQHRIVFTDTCQEDFLQKWRTACVKLILEGVATGGCVYKIKNSVVIIRRTPYQALPQEVKVGLLAHEIGHCVGLDHSQDPSHLMYPTIYTENSKPLEQEVAKLHSMWPEGHLFKFHLAEGY